MRGRKCCRLFPSLLVVLLVVFIQSAHKQAAAEEDAGDKSYYDILGVERDADDKEIRKAFKKLALLHHPDKNMDDPDASEKFIKINRAYEVLKDAETKKKYDLYGEEGLKEDHGRGRRYESWSFYKYDFGIYDDDPEVITLSQGDFEYQVYDSTDVWFINMYSPRCSHCHDLAPTWREVARELEGVIRIGAVNCGEEWYFCRTRGLTGYPTLNIHVPGKKPEKYTGSKTRADLIEFALKYISASYRVLTSHNYNAVFNDPKHRGKPWVLILCDIDEECLSQTSVKKLAAWMDNVANIGFVACESQATFCTHRFGYTSGTVYYPDGFVVPAYGDVISSLDAREIANIILKKLPDIALLSVEQFNEVRQDLEEGRTDPWLVQFFRGNIEHDLEFRKLPMLLPDVNIARFDCVSSSDVCKMFHVLHHPKLHVFKEAGSYEVYHGKMNTHDIVKFVKSSVVTSLRVLVPESFNKYVKDTSSLWLVDFFAPSCPPCRNLLPQLRKASVEVEGNVEFGTIDCSLHVSLCNQNNVRSYPTMIFFNQSMPHKLSGYHEMQDILEFIQDIINPAVVELTSESFEELVLNRDADDLWVVDFYIPNCGPCQQIEGTWRKLAKLVSDVAFVGKVNCDTHTDLCQREGVRFYPSMRLYRQDQTGSQFVNFRSWNWNLNSFKQWVTSNLRQYAVEMSGAAFLSNIHGGTEPWLVYFYIPWCRPCQQLAPVIEAVATQLKGIVSVGKLNCEGYSSVCRDLSLRSYPTLYMYDPVKQPMRSRRPWVSIPLKYDVNSLVQTVKTRLTVTRTATAPQIKVKGSHDEL